MSMLTAAYAASVVGSVGLLGGFGFLLPWMLKR